LAGTEPVRWLELASRVDGEAVEAVCEVFAGVAYGGVAVEPDLALNPDDGCALGAQATVRAYVPLDQESPAKTRRVEEALWHLRAIWPVGDLVVREVAEEDWANAWKSHYQTFRVGRRLVIRPTWLDYAPSDDDVVVSLDPGVAFGTGLHPTTQRCLQLLEAVVQPGDTVLDVGTGSGILSLAAIGLGARAALAVEVDPLAVAAARSNVAANGLTDRIQVVEGSTDQVACDAQYPVVVANIIARVILDLSPDLARHLRPGGTLIAGGIIADRAAAVIDRFQDLGLAVQPFTDGDWITLKAGWPSP
jgi:ribosomal protein L11 methyltransferase